MSYFVPISTALRDAFISEEDLKYLKVVIDPAGVMYTYYPIDISCEASQDFQKWSFSVKNRTGISVGLHANEACVVQVSHDNSTWVTVFTGYVSDDGFKRTRGMVTDDYLSLELVDATKRKGTKRKPEMALLSNFKTVDTSNTSTSVLHYLATLMGVSVETSDITHTHEILEVGNQTVWSELQALKEAFHADMYFRYDGKLLFRSPLEDSYSAPSSEWTFQGDPDNAVSGDACRIYGKLQEAYLPVKCNYAKTKFTDYELLSSRIIYKHTENYESSTDLISVEIGAGEYWPGPNAGDVAKLEYKDPDDGTEYPFAINIDTPTLGSVGSGNDIESTGGNLTLVSFNGSTGATSHEAGAAQIILYNDSASTCTLRKLTITGEPYHKEDDKIVEHVDSAVSDAVDYVEQEVDGKYMVSPTQAFDTLYHMVEEGKGRPRMFGFDAPFMPWIQRRAIVTVQPPGESSVRCVVNTYSHKNRGRTLQGMRTSIVCTELGTHTPTGDPYIEKKPSTPAWRAKLTSIAPNASATYRRASTSTPANPKLGDYWYQTDSQITKRYDGASWQNVGTSPFEESVTSGIAFETSSGKVKLYNDGSFEFGSYNPTTKYGGIKYDATVDRLYGNVAYDQWDLVIESDADLALLTTGSTTYENVLIAPGVYVASTTIDLTAHGVKRFVGVNKTSCTIDLDFVIGNTTNDAGVYCDSTVLDLGNFTIKSSTSQTSAFTVIKFSSIAYAYLHDINMSETNFNGDSVSSHGLLGASTSTNYGTIERCYFGYLSIAINTMRNITNCGFYACQTAVYGSFGVVNCYSVGLSDSGYGFQANWMMSNCHARSHNYGFESCYMISSCYSFGNNIGISGCYYISATYSFGNNTANWGSNTKVDGDSCNNV